MKSKSQFFFINVICFLFIPLVSSASTQIGTESISLPQSSVSKRKFDENADISDAALKANTGSLSPYSLRFNFAYSGPPVGDLNAADQPNPDGTAAVTATGASGSFGGRYRTSSASSVSLTAGLSYQYLFHDEAQADVNNPYLSYDHSFRWMGIQMISSPGVALITAQRLRAVAEVSSFNYALSTVYDIPKTRLAVGLNVTLAYYFFERRWLASDGKVRQESFSLNPLLKYNFTDKLNGYTTFGFSFYNPRSVDSRSQFLTKTTTEDLGVGYAWTRDIYLSPYASFFPSALTLDTTTINFSTVFSIF